MEDWLILKFCCFIEEADFGKCSVDKSNQTQSTKPLPASVARLPEKKIK